MKFNNFFGRAIVILQFLLPIQNEYKTHTYLQPFHSRNDSLFPHPLPRPPFSRIRENTFIFNHTKIGDVCKKRHFESKQAKFHGFLEKNQHSPWYSSGVKVLEYTSGFYMAVGHTGLPMVLLMSFHSFICFPPPFRGKDSWGTGNIKRPLLLFSVFHFVFIALLTCWCM